MTLVHRCLNEMAPVIITDRFERNAQYGQQVTRGGSKVHLHLPKTKFYRKSIKFRAAQDWNELPSELRDIKSTATFRKESPDVYIARQAFILL